MQFTKDQKRVIDARKKNILGISEYNIWECIFFREIDKSTKYY